MTISKWMLIINWKDTLKRKQNKSEWNKVRKNTHAKKINRNAAAATWATQLNSNWILTVYSLKRIISEQPSHIMARDFHIRLSIHHPLRLWSEMHVCVCVLAEVHVSSEAHIRRTEHLHSAEKVKHRCWLVFMNELCHFVVLNFEKYTLG